MKKFTVVCALALLSLMRKITRSLKSALALVTLGRLVTVQAVAFSPHSNLLTEFKTIYLLD